MTTQRLIETAATHREEWETSRSFAGDLILDAIIIGVAHFCAILAIAAIYGIVMPLNRAANWLDGKADATTRRIVASVLTASE